MIIDKTTIPYDTFVKIPTGGSERFKNEIRTVFGQKFEDTHLIGKKPGKENVGYALCIGVEDISQKVFNSVSIPGVIFNKIEGINDDFINDHHDFFKRNDESVDETIQRISNFKNDGGLSYVVQEFSGKIIGTLQLKQQGSIAVVFSFMVLPERRKKGLGKLLLGNVHEDVKSKGVKSIWAKTKNKYVYLLLTRGYGGDVLRKEIYL